MAGSCKLSPCFCFLRVFPCRKEHWKPFFAYVITSKQTSNNSTTSTVTYLFVIHNVVDAAAQG